MKLSRMGLPLAGAAMVALAVACGGTAVVDDPISGSSGGGDAPGCLRCSEFDPAVGDTVDDLCASSRPLLDTVLDCACTTCAADCGDNLCAGKEDLAACGACALTACASEIATCEADE